MPPSPIQDTVVGDRLVIYCITTTPVAVDVSLLDFNWIGPGGMITDNSRITISPIMSMNNTYISSLQFAYLIFSDGGSYTCNVEFFNVLGSGVIVMDNPDCKCLAFCMYIHMQL